MNTDQDILNRKNSANMTIQKNMLYYLAKKHGFVLNKFIRMKNLKDDSIIEGIFTKYKIPKGKRNLKSLLLKTDSCSIEIISNSNLNYKIIKFSEKEYTLLDKLSLFDSKVGDIIMKENSFGKISEETISMVGYYNGKRKLYLNSYSILNNKSFNNKGIKTTYTSGHKFQEWFYKKIK